MMKEYSINNNQGRNSYITGSFPRKIKHHKIGIITYYRFNYGSILQCYATCEILKKYEFDPTVLNESYQSLSRLHTLLKMMHRCITHPRYINEFYSIWKSTTAKSLDSISSVSRKAMEQFIENYIPVVNAPYSDLQRDENKYVAFLSGSDQIWNGHMFLINKSFFLRFAPIYKRIAWAPSFGTDDIATYNVKIYKKYISEYASLSVREVRGKQLIKDLTGRDAVQLLDPVFLLSKTDWEELCVKQNGGYVFCYFLNKPSEQILDDINNYCKQYHLSAVLFGNHYEAYKKISASEYIEGGPIEFLSFIDNADCVLTDSFHATSFAIILHRDFYAFKRNYSHGVDQSSRLKSILALCEMEQFFEAKELVKVERDFSYADQRIELKKQEAIGYLLSSINTAKKYGDANEK